MENFQEVKNHEQPSQLIKSSMKITFSTTQSYLAQSFRPILDYLYLVACPLLQLHKFMLMTFHRSTSHQSLQNYFKSSFTLQEYLTILLSHHQSLTKFHLCCMDRGVGVRYRYTSRCLILYIYKFFGYGNLARKDFNNGYGHLDTTH